MSILFFFLAFCVWLVLRLAFTPDNSSRAKMERLLAAEPGLAPDYRLEDAYNVRILVLDTAAQQMALCSPGKKLRLIPFSHLVTVEVERDGVTIEKASRGSQAAGAAIGGVLLGPAGFIVGGLSGKRIHEKTVTRLVLRLTVSDLDDPVVDMVFHDAKGMEWLKPQQPRKGTPEERLVEWYGRLRVIIARCEGSAPPPSPEQTFVPTAPVGPGGFGRRRGLVAQG